MILLIAEIILGLFTWKPEEEKGKRSKGNNLQHPTTLSSSKISNEIVT